ncbi:MAG: hypothetical protein ABSC16_12405 [Candidatus Dormibacteria bacterium]|jgi:hypothetical protein|nr:hypothetical protein [Chloroflexota bacterium]
MAHETTARDRAAAAHRALAQSVEVTDGDVRLTDSAKNAIKAHAYLKARAQVADARREHEAVVAAQRRELERNAFGYPADPDRFRDALNGASERITTRTQAAAALRRAERTGDDLAAHAVFVIAAEKGFGDIVDSYAARHPESGSALQRLRDHDAAADTVAEKLFSPLRPPQLPRGLPPNEDRLARLAAEARASDPPNPFGLPAGSR